MSETGWIAFGMNAEPWRVAAVVIVGLVAILALAFWNGREAI